VFCAEQCATEKLQELRNHEKYVHVGVYINSQAQNFNNDVMHI